MKSYLPHLLLGLLSSIGSLHAAELNIVPYPADAKLTESEPFVLKKSFIIRSNADFAPAAKLFLADVNSLYDIKGKHSEGYGHINLVKIKSLPADEYQLVVTSKGIILKASSYPSMVMGLTTLLQIVEAKTKSIPTCSIKDKPAFAYRAYRLNLDRQWIEIETIKNIIKLCRWYKVPYLQLLLNNEQVLTEDTKLYTQAQLRDLVDYATEHGVSILPELNLTNEEDNAEAIAMKVLEIFPNAPYYHMAGVEKLLKAKGKDSIPSDTLIELQSPQAQELQKVIKQGYNIINASCKPYAITPKLRYSPEDIYQWSPSCWENAASTDTDETEKVELKDNSKLAGLQMSAWKLMDYEQVLSAHERIPAFSESGWNAANKQDYEDYKHRAQSSDRKILQLIFPAAEKRTGFESIDPKGIDNNQFNSFHDEASIFIKPLDPSYRITYTTDGSMPTTDSTPMEKAIVLKEDTVVKYGIFNPKGEMVAYKSAKYILLQN